MILTGTVISTLWIMYGIITNEMFMLFQNGVFLILNVIQLSLFVIYPSKPVEEKKDDSSTNNDNKKKN